MELTERRLLSLTILPTELGLVIACADAGSTIGGRAKAFARFGFARTIDQTSIHSVSDSPRPSTRGLSAYEWSYEEGANPRHKQ
jgi:hypothetical protein